jgi:hypothetical protein
MFGNGPRGMESARRFDEQGRGYLKPASLRSFWAISAISSGA